MSNWDPDAFFRLEIKRTSITRLKYDHQLGWMEFLDLLEIKRTSITRLKSVTTGGMALSAIA